MFLIFDFDGVISDSRRAVNIAANRLQAHFGLPPVTVEESTARWLGPSIAVSVPKLRSDLGVDDSDEMLAQMFFDAYVEAAPDHTDLFPGMADLLDELDELRIPKALATMKAQSEMDAMSRRLDGLDHFEVIACPPSHAEATAPKEHLVKQAIEDLVASGAIDDQMAGVMIGDRSSDIHAGRTNGLSTVAVTWGGGDVEELKATHPDHLVTSSDELRQLIFRMLEHNAA